MERVFENATQRRKRKFREFAQAYQKNRLKPRRTSPLSECSHGMRAWPHRHVEEY